MTGDVFLLYRCGHCDRTHAHHVAPLDEERAALGVALAVAWIYERAEGATDCQFLVSAIVEGEAHAIAIRRDGETLTGSTAHIEREHSRHLDAAEAFAHAAREGRPLPTERADEAGLNRLVENAFRGARSAQLTLERLLAEVEIDLDR